MEGNCDENDMPGWERFEDKMGNTSTDDSPLNKTTGHRRRYSIIVNKRRPSTSFQRHQNIPNENRLFFHSRDQPRKSTKMSANIARISGQPGSDTEEEEEEEEEEDNSDAISIASHTSSLDSLSELQKRIKEIRNARKVKIAKGSILTIPTGVLCTVTDQKEVLDHPRGFRRFEQRQGKNTVILTTGKQLPLKLNEKQTIVKSEAVLVKSRRKFHSEGNIQTGTLQTRRSEKYSNFSNDAELKAKKDRRNSVILSKMIAHSVQTGHFDTSDDLDSPDMRSYQHRKSLRRGSLLTHEGVEATPRELARKRRSSLAVPFYRSRRQSIALGDDVIGEQIMDNRSRRNTRRGESMARDFQLVIEKQKQKRAVALERFRRAVRIVKICVKLCLWSLLKAAKEKTTYIPLGHLSSGGTLMFDPDYYKAQRQQRLSDEAKLILQKHPTERTEKELQYVQIALRNIRAFATYPIRMQVKLCRVGWLEEFGPGRAIVRQGHPPTTFYFILYGTLVVSVLNMADGKKTPQAVAYLNRGDSFGELAILNNTRRASTVLTEDDTQLLCISVQDYEDIFMVSGGIKHVNDPDQHAFFTSLRFLKHWPINVFQNHPNDCLFHFFKAGDLLVKESVFSPWIYIIKSVSLQ
ncbi:uncharacterized protein [Apostichopus japonicus]|uniref:uncharacterized protein n=1 Tax=Stichopus japonicus TaxID=307972 RepID=UPI003AB8F6E4